MSYLPGSLYTFQTVTTTPVPLTVGNRLAYVCKGTGVLNFQLPLSSTAGMSFKIIGQNCLWTVVQNAMQQIAFGSLTSNPGITGGISSTALNDQIELTCLNANLTWEVTQSMGNLNIN